MKDSNLIVVNEIPDNRDKPHRRFWSPDSYDVRTRTKNGKEKKCVECECDLDGKYYVYYNDKYRYEEHFVKTFLPLHYVICAQCYEYMPLCLRIRADYEVLDIMFARQKRN